MEKVEKSNEHDERRQANIRRNDILAKWIYEACERHVSIFTDAEAMLGTASEKMEQVVQNTVPLNIFLSMVKEYNEIKVMAAKKASLVEDRDQRIANLERENERLKAELERARKRQHSPVFAEDSAHKCTKVSGTYRFFVYFFV